MEREGLEVHRRVPPHVWPITILVEDMEVWVIWYQIPLGRRPPDAIDISVVGF